jgi:hypothetical protein
MSTDDALRWYDELDDYERAAVDAWLNTGDTSQVDALRPYSPALAAFDFKPFNLADLCDGHRREQADDATHDYAPPGETFAGYRDEYLPDDAESVFGENTDLWPHTDQAAIVFPSDFSLN